MDWVPVLAFALGALFNAVVGLIGSEVRATRDEGRRERREASERLRQRNLAIVHATQAMTLSWCEWVIQRIRGFPPEDFLLSRFPRANASVTGEPAVRIQLDLYAALADPSATIDRQRALVSRDRLAAMNELEQQEERVLRGEGLIEIGPPLSERLAEHGEREIREAIPKPTF